MTLIRLDEEKTGTEAGSESAGQTRARRLLTGWGAAPLSYFALLADKRYLWDSEREPLWGVAYRKIGRHALALGDPLGDPDAVSEAVAAFLQLCRRHWLTPAFYQVTPDHLPIYRNAGLRAVKVGEEAEILLRDFSLAGKRFKNLRNDLRRIEKTGVALEEFGPDSLPNADAVKEMVAICAGWRRAHRAREATFAMGGFDPKSALFAESRIFAARDTASGRLLAFTTFVPVFGPGGTRGWALDLMRRRADALHGVMDFLIVSAAQQFAGEGADLLSLGLSPLAGSEEPGETPQFTLVRRFLFRRMGRAYNFGGLHTFKAKFANHWEARYLVYRPGMALAATAGAILRAHLTPETKPARKIRRPIRRGGLLLTALLLLLTPFEKTLAKRAVTHPRHLAHFSSPFPAHFHTLHFHPHMMHFGMMHFGAAGRTWGREWLPAVSVA